MKLFGNFFITIQSQTKHKYVNTSQVDHAGDGMLEPTEELKRLAVRFGFRLSPVQSHGLFKCLS